jgi:hypothetical protein
LITYSISNAKNCFEEIRRLLQLHYEEVSLIKNYPLNPDYSLYMLMDSKDLIKVILCKKDNQIIGYIVFALSKHLHYQDCLVANEDIYFLMPEYRQGRTGIRMFKFAEEYLKSINVDMIKYSTKVHLDKSSIFEYLGYENTEKVFTKMLKA